MCIVHVRALVYFVSVCVYNIDTIFTLLIILSVIIKSVQERINAMNINKLYSKSLYNQ